MFIRFRKFLLQFWKWESYFDEDFKEWELSSAAESTSAADLFKQKFASRKTQSAGEVLIDQDLKSLRR